MSVYTCRKNSGLQFELRFSGTVFANNYKWNTSQCLTTVFISIHSPLNNNTWHDKCNPLYLLCSPISNRILFLPNLSSFLLSED